MELYRGLGVSRFKGFRVVLGFEGFRVLGAVGVLKVFWGFRVVGFCSFTVFGFREASVALVFKTARACFVSQTPTVDRIHHVHQQSRVPSVS